MNLSTQPLNGSSALSSEVIDELYDFALTVTWDPGAAGDAVRRGLRRVSPRTAGVPELFSRVRDEAVRLSRPPESAVLDVNEELPAPADLPVPMIESIALGVLDGLDPYDRAVLDLALRRDLSGHDLATSLGVPPSATDEAVEDARARVDNLLGHYVLARIGHDTCPKLRQALGDPPPDRLTPLGRRVEAHLGECSLCTDRRLGLTPVTSMLDAIPARAAPEDLHDALGHLWEKEGVEAQEAARGRRRWTVLVAAVAVVVATGALIGLRLFGDDGSSSVEETATTLAPVLRADTTGADFGLDASAGSAVVRNVAGHRVSYRVEVDVPWLTVSPLEGEIAAGDSVRLSLVIDRAAAPEGEVVTTIRVVSSGTTTEIDVSAEIPKGPEVAGVVVDPPQVSVAPCGEAPATARLGVTVDAVSNIQSVVAKTSQGDVPLQDTGGVWQATLGPYPAAGTVTLSVVATDTAGKSGTSPELTLQVTDCPAPPRRR